MGVESLHGAEGLDDRQRFFQRGFVVTDDAGAALELLGSESRKGLAGPSRGKLMAWPGKEITGRHRRDVAEKDATGGIQA